LRLRSDDRDDDTILNDVVRLAW